MLIIQKKSEIFKLLFFVIIFIMFGAITLFPKTVVKCYQVYYDEQSSEAKVIKNNHYQPKTDITTSLSFQLSLPK